MPRVCTKIDEWIEEEVSKPVEEWEERQEKRCKDYPWYDPRGWVCWFVTILVKVVRWVVVTVGRWVTRTVCKIVAAAIEGIKDIVGGVWDVIAGIFTLDWRRILDGLLGIGIGIVVAIIGIGRIIFLGDTIDFIRGLIERKLLRDHVRELLEGKYKGDTLDAIKDAIRLDHGAFGLRLRGSAVRTFLDSETRSPGGSAPNLVVLHEAGSINLRELCGFEFNEGFWNRKRYKTLKKETVVTGGGGGEFDNPISEDDLDLYLSSRGARGPAFIVLCMRDGVLETKLNAAEDKASELGLVLSWEERRIEVTAANEIVQPGNNPQQANFLATRIGRTRKSVNPSAAAAELCTPLVVGVFRYPDTLRGLATLLEASPCGLSASDTSGSTFIDNHPDTIWKYVPIHELGHCFGLCHVDGIDRIMLSTKQNSWWNWTIIPNIYLKGEPHFTFGEAKSTWTYIVANFLPACLSTP